jgi:hypothetical protein
MFWNFVRCLVLVSALCCCICGMLVGMFVLACCYRFRIMWLAGWLELGFAVRKSLIFKDYVYVSMDWIFSGYLVCGYVRFQCLRRAVLIIVGVEAM